tara:strand:- start:545 stop:1753 length:1209 start_codon:yes stop_codon:yes gene_type:complete
MKSFSKFLTEAASNAAKQAKKLGLTGDGHGSWVDPDGRIVGRTVEGELVFNSGRKPANETDPLKPGSAARQTVSEVPPPSVPGSAPEELPPPEEQGGVEKTRGTLTLGFGRFNPPTAGHEKLLDKIKDTAEGGQYTIYPSHSEDNDKNPIGAEDKVLFMRKIFPDHSNSIVYDPSIRTIIDALTHADVQGYQTVNLVVGGDRQKEFESLANKYNGELYTFDAINVISAGDRDPDAEGTEGMSASKLRALAADGDFEAFKKGLPKAAKGSVAQELFNTVQKSIGKKAVATKEGIELWQIAPKLDFKSLREHFISGSIFNIGTLVENLNTGLIGRVLRKGTNYVIAVNEQGIMFKSWINDIMESKPPSGVVASKREVGTDSYREYVQALTPAEKIRSFINNNRK